LPARDRPGDTEHPPRASRATTPPYHRDLAPRRARITPDEAGLRSYGSGPGACLRREEVAPLAGVSIAYYTKLERGDASGVSETVLEALARALRLDDAERAHLVDLARAQHLPRMNAYRRPMLRPKPLPFSRSRRLEVVRSTI
jgi:transcriptional regulator with XRE-family HTH domain